MRRLLALLVLPFVLYACTGDGEPQSQIVDIDAEFDVTAAPKQQDWRQCENGKSFDSICDWITGNLTHTANTYPEGTMVPKVLRIPTITDATPIVLEMTYGVLKGGKTTHDFLGRWNKLMHNAEPCEDNRFSAFCTGGGALAPITATSLNIEMYDESMEAVTAACSGVPGGAQKIADMEDALDKEDGDLVIQGVNVASITIDDIVFDGCPNSGDAEAFLTMTVTPNAEGVTEEEMLVLFGAHVAETAIWDNGGAGGVNGSPYHLGLSSIGPDPDGGTINVGSVDLQMSAEAVPDPEPKAAIAISPDGTNRVGDNHVFTATVTLQADVGEPFLPAAGETVTFTESGPGSFVGGNTCVTAADGTCTVTLSSTATGVSTVGASVSDVGGTGQNASTDGVAPNSGNAIKTWVDAKIAIGPDGLNPVGQSHTFTVTVQKDLGNGGGFVAAAGVLVTASKTGGGVGTFVGGVNTCTTGAGGTCTVSVNSDATGQMQVSASGTVTIATESIAVTTNGLLGSSGPATKTWGNAWITIESDDTNRVDESHTFTVSVQRQVGAGSPEGVDVTVTGAIDASSTAGSFVGGNTCSTGTDGVCTLTVNSSSTGKAIVSASADVPIDGTTISVSTDGNGNNSDPANKTWVDGYIEINPDALNPVGQSHTFTVTVWQDKGDESGFVAADDGTTITATKEAASTTGSFVGGVNTCNTSSGTCTIDVNSATAGSMVVSASASLTVMASTGNKTFSVSTDGSAVSGSKANSGPATKTWGTAWITIETDATNEVGQSHTFTVSVQRDTGSGAEGVENVSVTPSGDTGALQGTGTCETGNTDSNGVCTFVVNSTTAGQASIGASASVPLNGTNVSVQTDNDAATPSSPPAVKTWVDAKIQISPLNDTNPVNESHTFTVTVMEDAGDGSGFVAAAGETVTVSNQTGSLAPLTFGGTCTGGGVTDAQGMCTLTANTASAGDITVEVSSDVSVGGLSLTRKTDSSGNNSGPAMKTWVTARISISGDATNRVGDSHTFTVTVEENAGSGFVAAADEAVAAFIVSNGAGATITGGTCDDTPAGDTGTDGTCTIVVNSTSAGTIVMGATSTVAVGGLSVFTQINSTTGSFGTKAATPAATKTWVDAKISIAADGLNPVGLSHTFTVTVEADDGSGGGFAGVDGVTVTGSQTGGTVGSFVGGNTCITAGGGFCTLTVNSASPGVMQVTASASVTVLGLPINVTTNGSNGSSGPATKTWFEICAQGDRVVFLELEVNSITGGGPVGITVLDGNGKNNLLPVDQNPSGPYNVGDKFQVEPAGGATTFKSQNLRFLINGESATGTIHLSCSDDPEIGDIHFISGDVTVELEKTGIFTAPKN